MKHTPSVSNPLSVMAVTLGLAALYAIMLSRFDLHLLFTDTVLTGGDSASWLQPLKHLTEEYLPHLRLFGYSHSNFFGYLEGQHYFILPFFYAALLGFFMPLTVALKIATVTGAFALPLTMYFGVRQFSKNEWTALLASAGSLIFLFNESYSMFGGNFLSTFSGEFCYSWAIAFFPLFLASAWEDHAGKRWSMRSGLLLGAIGLSHIFVFMVAFFLPFFFAFRKRNVSGAAVSSQEVGPCDPAALVLHIPLTYLVALLLMAFWLVPMVATRSWAQSISMIWHFSSFLDFARQTGMWVWVGGTLAALVMAFFPGRSNTTNSSAGEVSASIGRKGAFLLFGLAASGFLFYVATVLEVPDIRFVPPALILSIFAFALLIDNYLEVFAPSFARHLKPPVALAVIVAVGMVIHFTGWNAPTWFKWNYSGYEDKAQWASLARMAQAYQGGIEDGRFLWEKQDQADNKDFGSERGFENLYYFFGRPTTEGVHYGSSFMARSITYLQSAYSLNPVDPEAHRLYSIVDPQSWPLRFKQANAHHIVTYSPEITRLFAEHIDFRLDKAFGKFSVFEYLGFPGSYIEVLPPDTVYIVKDSSAGFKTDFYRFFRDYELIRRPFVPASFADKALREKSLREYSSYDALHDRYGLTDEWKSYAASPSRGRITDEKIDSFSISFRTSNPGQPHLIKASFAPGWQSKHGERIYPVSPGWMLLYPKNELVELEYGRTNAEWIGIFATLLIIPAIFFRKRLAALRLPAFKPFFIVAILLFFSVMSVFLVLSFFGTAKMTRDIESARSLNLGDVKARTKALSLVKPYANEKYLDRYDNRLVFDAYRIEAEVLRLTGKVDQARGLITMLKNRYSHTRDIAGLPQF